jgi:hypothetical protein
MISHRHPDQIGSRPAGPPGPRPRRPEGDALLFMSLYQRLQEAEP